MLTDATDVQGHRAQAMHLLGGKLVFISACGPASGLYSQDLASDDTLLLLDRRPPWETVGRVRQDLLCFATVASWDASERSLWVTDGSLDGTRPIAQLTSATKCGSEGVCPLGGCYGLWHLGTFHDRAFLGALDPGEETTRVWATDGTSEGTTLLLEVAVQGAEQAYSGNPIRFSRALGPLADELLVGAGSAIWATDGTSAGTRLVAAVSARADGTRFGGTILFSGDDGMGGAGLWESDGTAEGTRLLVPDLDGPHGSAELDGRLIFTVRTTAGWSLWTTDGSSTGPISPSWPSKMGSGTGGTRCGS
jgi:ELWxxDGT repeat protein